MSLSRPSWPTVPPALVARVLAGHSAVALALGALIYLVCLTGTLCVFIDELKVWEAPRPAPAAFDPRDSDRVLAQALAAAGGPSKVGALFLRAPVTPRQRTEVSAGAQRWALEADGRLVPLALAWSSFLEDLHYTLAMPAPWGEALVGLLGMALLSLLISGVIAHPRILRDAFMLRLGGGRRLQEADIHNRLGVWALPFHLAVTLTGTLFGLTSLMAVVLGAMGPPGEQVRALRRLAGPEAARDARRAPLPPIARAVAESLALQPGSSLYYVGVTAPGTRGAEVSVQVTAPGRLPRGDMIFFDSRGRLIGRRRFASGAAGLQLYSGAAEVHFGFFAGLAGRLAYGVLGWALCWVCAGGASIWLARRRDRGRPAPRLEAAWSGCVWGAPLALALAALPTPMQGAPGFWLALALLLLASQGAAAAVRSSLTVDRMFRAALAAGLLLVGALHVRNAAQSGIAAAVELGLTAAAAGLAVSVRDLGGGRRGVASRPGGGD